MSILKNIYRKLLEPLYLRHEALERELSALKPQTVQRQADEAAFFQEIEPGHVSLNPARLNWRNIGLYEISDALHFGEVAGDYCEFGVAHGNSFAHAYWYMAKKFPEMRFIAFDSFQGLPEPQGVDQLEDGTTSTFYKGGYACDKSEFMANINRYGLDLARVTTVEGWYSESLTTQTAQRINLNRIALAWVDCDLYESTVPVLQFITPYLVEGSVIVFDDWRCFRNRADRGQQRACTEWLAANPGLQLAELMSLGWSGIVFTVTETPQTSRASSVS